MKMTFVDESVPVIVGEYGGDLKPQYRGMSKYRDYGAQYVTHSMYRHGLVPMWWDTGELFDRATGAPKAPDVIGAIVNNSK